ncbi:MAG: ABC transporter substrate-binding protein [Chloroflexi bacterium]|nr:ABC transporter substrate-binding protein [Chloroflexota bacterium]
MFSKGLKVACLFLVLGLALVFASACSKAKQEVSSTPTSEAAGEPKIGGTLHITGSSPPNFDPITSFSGAIQSGVSYAYDRLFELPYGPDKPYNSMQTVPHLAKGWKMESPTTFLVTIRDDVKWQNKPPMNGRKFMADDVKFAVERLKSPGSAAGAGLLDLQKIEVVDPYTVRFVLAKPNSFFIYSLSYSHFHMMPREVVEQYGDLKKPETLIGTGAFMLDKYEPNVRTVYKKNPDYYEKDDKGRQLPYLDEVEVKVASDPATSMAMFRTGQIDTRGLNVNEQKDIRGSMPNVKILQSPIASAPRVWWMRTDKPPFSDIRVRQAMAMSIDHQKYLDVFHGGKGAIEGPLTLAVEEYHMPIEKRPASVQKYYKLNIPEAKKLLTEAGYPNGFKTVMYSTAGMGPELAQQAEVAQEFLRAVGIDAELKLLDYNVWVNTAVNGINYGDGMVFGMSGAVYDPFEMLYSTFYGVPNQKNRSAVADKKLDAMLDQMIATYDEAARKKIIDDIQVYLSEQQYWIWFPQGPGYAGVQPWLKNYGYQAGQGVAYRWVRVWLDK